MYDNCFARYFPCGESVGHKCHECIARADKQGRHIPRVERVRTVVGVVVGHCPAEIVGFVSRTVVAAMYVKSQHGSRASSCAVRQPANTCHYQNTGLCLIKIYISADVRVVGAPFYRRKGVWFLSYDYLCYINKDKFLLINYY